MFCAGYHEVMIEKIKHLARLMRLHKPVGILLLLWPTLWALWLASDGHPDPTILLIFVLGVFIMRSAGCVMNDIADRRIDGFVERTHDRPLASQKISVCEAIILFVILMTLAFFLVLQLNGLTILLAFLGALLTVFYPFLKRFTHLPQVGLGIAFSWGIPLAFSATTQTLPDASWLLFAAAVIWPVIYDTQYAMADRPDDLKIGVKSTAILFGQWDRALIGCLQIAFLILFVIVGIEFVLSAWYFLSVLLTGTLFIYQQWLIKNRDRKACFQAFLNHQWVGGVIFLGLAMSYL